jgi:hypothetical protein
VEAKVSEAKLLRRSSGLLAELAGAFDLFMGLDTVQADACDELCAKVQACVGLQLLPPMVDRVRAVLGKGLEGWVGNQESLKLEVFQRVCDVLSHHIGDSDDWQAINRDVSTMVRMLTFEPILALTGFKQDPEGIDMPTFRKVLSDLDAVVKRDVPTTIDQEVGKRFKEIQKQMHVEFSVVDKQLQQGCLARATEELKTAELELQAMEMGNPEKNDEVWTAGLEPNCKLEDLVAKAEQTLFKLDLQKLKGCMEKYEACVELYGKAADAAGVVESPELKEQRNKLMGCCVLRVVEAEMLALAKAHVTGAGDADRATMRAGPQPDRAPTDR